MNLLRSEIILVSEVDGVESLASILWCRAALLPMKYLSLPLGVIQVYFYMERHCRKNGKVRRGCICQRELG
jgi:hypothetical protein